MHRLWPDATGGAGGTAGKLTEVELAELYAYPQPLQRPFVRVNFVSSLDGAVTMAGRSGGLSDPADQQLFALLRALADVVLAGAGTVRVEGYRGIRFGAEHAKLRARLGLAATPPIAVVSGSAALDPGSGLCTDTAVPPIVFTTEAAPADRKDALAAAGAHVVVAGEQWVDPAVALAELGRRGLCRVLCEGGPQLLGDLVVAQLVDEMCLTLAPMLLAGPADRIAHSLGEPSPQGLRLASALHDDDTLLLRYVRSSEGALR